MLAPRVRWWLINSPVLMVVAAGVAFLTGAEYPAETVYGMLVGQAIAAAFMPDRGDHGQA